MTFQEVRFPENISYGAVSSPGFKTTYLESDGGTSFRNGSWSMSKHRFNVGHALKKFDDVAVVRDFYHSMRGGLHSFRFKDWLDYTSAPGDRALDQGSVDLNDTDQTLGTGDASKVAYQLIKNYTDAAQIVTRDILKPVENTVVVALDGVPQASGWSVDLTTGIVTFDTAPGIGVIITAGFKFDVPVFFAKETDEGLSASMEAFDAGTVSIILEEEWTPTQRPEGAYTGGSKDHGDLTATRSISRTQGLVHRAAPSVASVSLSLPEPGEFSTGGPIFVCVNEGTFALGVKVGTDADFASILVGDVSEIYVVSTSTGNEYRVFG